MNACTNKMMGKRESDATPKLCGVHLTCSCSDKETKFRASKSPIQVDIIILTGTNILVPLMENQLNGCHILAFEDCCNYHMAYDFGSCIKGGYAWQ